MTIPQNIGLDTRIFIVHPQYRQPRYLLSALINLSNVLYLRFDNPGVVDTSDSGNYEFVILDEFDRLSVTQAEQVIEILLNQYPQSYLIIFSRHLPDLPMNQRALALLFPVDDEIGLIDYYSQSRTVVEFFAFGKGAMAINGKRHELLLDDTQFLLLFYLLEKDRASLDTLIRMFWKDMSPKRATRALHNLKMRLNDALGIELLVFRQSYYQLNPEFEIVYDVANYQRLVESAHHAPFELSEKLFAQANLLYKGDYLRDSHEEWLTSIQEALQRTQADVQAHLGKLYAEQAQREQATAWYSYALKHNPARDDVLMALMRLFIELNMPCYALNFFKRYEEILREKHGIAPSERFKPLYESAKKACEG